MQTKFFLGLFALTATVIASPTLTERGAWKPAACGIPVIGVSSPASRKRYPQTVILTNML